MAKPSPHPKSPPSEQLCNNCGKCCYKKIIVGRTVFITPFPCEFLDTDTNLCTIYDKRHELNPLCLSIEEGMKVNAFPEDCPYVPEMAPPQYRPARDSWNWAGEWDDFDDLADDLDVPAEMREKVRARGPTAPPMYTAAYDTILAKRAAESARADVMIWGRSPSVVSMAHPLQPARDGSDETPRLADMASKKNAKTRRNSIHAVTRALDASAPSGGTPE